MNIDFRSIVIDNSKQLWGREPVMYILLIQMVLTQVAAQFPQFHIDVPFYVQLAFLIIAFITRANVSPAGGAATAEVPAQAEPQSPEIGTPIRK